MPKPTAGKWRALRVALQKHSEMDAFERGRLWLSLLAVAVVVGWFLAGFLRGDGGKNRFSPGPLSVNHQQFDCSTCHDDFSPMHDDVVGAGLSGWHNTDGGRWDRGADAKCMACHPLAAMPDENSDLTKVSDRGTTFNRELIEKPLSIYAHSSNEKTGAIESCASCHIEHRGNDVHLTRVNDAACVRCHQNLNACAVAPTDFANKVTRFYDGHPEFRSLKKDAGTMQDFNHRLHMWPGLNPSDSGNTGSSSSGRKDYKPEDFDANDKSLKNFTDQETGLVQLRCEFCHTPVGSQTGSATGDVDLSQFGGKSELMTMPTYEQSCKVCHPIDIVPGSDQLIRHGLSPEENRNELIDHLVISEVESIRESIDPANELTPEQERLAEDVWDAIEKGAVSTRLEQLQVMVEKGEMHLRIRCEKCHQWAQADEGQSPRDMVGPIKQIDKSNGVFARSWFEHGRFDHFEHRDMDCARCHGAADPKQHESSTGLRASEKNSDVLIDNYQTCVACHQPVENVKNAVDRAATYNCTSCHTYHGGGNRAFHILNHATK